MKQVFERAKHAVESHVAERRERIAQAVRESGVRATVRGDAVVISGRRLEQRLVDDVDLRLAIGGQS